MFLKQWGISKDNRCYVNYEFNTLKRNNDEIVLEFTSRFLNIYHHIPKIIYPSKTTIMVAYLVSFKYELTLHLK
jgi:hypothetical protein